VKFLLLAAMTLTPVCAYDPEPARRLADAATVFADVMAAPDSSIPPVLLEHAYCIVIVSGEKGFVFCRNNAGPGWSAPGAIRVEGRLIEGQTDFVMLVLNEERADQLLSSKFTLGAEASIAPGPLGHTSGQIHADILSWSRSHGLFGGKALDGVTLRQDLEANAALYGGNRLESRDIVTEGIVPPLAAAKILDLLNHYSFRD
jgi:lipid-binding SYLF domain-containing protein